MKQGAVLDRTLPTADDNHVLSLEPAEVVVIAGVGDESSRQIGILFGTMGIVAEADGHDDGGTLDLPPIFQRQKKLIAATFDPGDVGLINIGHHTLLKPLGVFDER